ncbi:TetR/AcrR family transcriptional regulator [Virgibacillus oceani]|uniref:TetR family transcriptional regulator n=1 Tax=Virgibacillus oceani TaxID=1479511 RepID=A0A917M414_9BACI|nr:TetR/AcrR family transcriptional regulator [Virgibacillus oceani]GGG75919.1 TetR family transcriptional regulator [Virgibacillus oceani]
MKRKQERPLGRPRQSEKKQPTNQLIIQAATRLFLENGYQHVSIDNVANKSNVTKATVYYYYASKAELFTETMVQLMVHIGEKINALLHENLPLKERLLNITKTHLKGTVNVDMAGFMKGTKNTLSNDQHRRIEQAEGGLYQAIENAFMDAMEQNEIRMTNAAFLAQAYLSLLKVGYYNNEKQQILPTIEEVAEQIIELFWHGVHLSENEPD